MAGSVLMPIDAETLRCHMEHQRGKLIDIIDSEFGLLNICLEQRVLSISEIGRIKAKASSYEKNEQLLLFIANNEKEEDFLTALEESSQTHVANWIIADGNYKDEFGLNWPLANEENEKLDRNQRTLVEILDTCDLLNRLYSKDVINKWQKESIEAKQTSHDKNEALLEIVRRLSRKGYYIFINCLRDSIQGHVADILENGGAIVPVHATLQGDNLDEAETKIVNEVTDFICQRATSLEQANRLIAEVQLNIMAVRRGESIVLYIGCCTEENLNRLCDIVDDRKMKEILERLFNLFIHKLGFRVLVLLVNISENDLTTAKETFKRIRRMKLNPNYYDDSSSLGRFGWKIKDDSNDSHDILKSPSTGISMYDIHAATDVPYIRFCVDCGRLLERREDRKHVKCSCGCEFCCVCLKKAGQGESANELRCKLDDNCSLAPYQTKDPHSSLKIPKNPPDFPRRKLEPASSEPSQLSVSKSMRAPSTSFPHSRRWPEGIDFNKLMESTFARKKKAAKEDDSDMGLKGLSLESCALDVTDVQQFRDCVDCGRRLKRTDESKHIKCICGCEFCFVCLKKTEEVGSVKVLRCQLDDTCSAAPRQTGKSFNKPKGAKGRFRSASPQSSDPEPNPSQSAPFELRSADTKKLV